MPKYVPLEANSKTYSVTGIVGNTAGWQNGQDRFDSGSSFTVTRRNPASGQTTRKSSVRLSVPLIDVCENTCSTTSRGSILTVIDFTTGLESSQSEREAAYDDILALLGTESVKQAIVNNEPYWG